MSEEVTPESIALSVIACYAAQMTEKATATMLIEFGILRASIKEVLYAAKDDYIKALADGCFQKGTPEEYLYLHPVLQAKRDLACVKLAERRCSAADHTGDDLRTFVTQRISETVGDAGLALATNIEHELRPDYMTTANSLLQKLVTNCQRVDIDFPLPTHEQALEVYRAFADKVHLR